MDRRSIGYHRVGCYFVRWFGHRDSPSNRHAGALALANTRRGKPGGDGSRCDTAVHRCRAPVFQAALLERQAIDQELAAPGSQAQSRYVATWLVRVTDMRLRLVDAVKVVEPPESLASNHDDFVLATSAWVALGDELVERIAEAGVQFNVAADLAGDPELGVTAANQLSIISSAACARIEGLAAANGIDADLACDAIVE